MIEEMAKIENLQSAVEAMHKCKARHVASTVVDLFRDQVQWNGVVETFELKRHRKAKRCYAWSYIDGDEHQYVAVLEIPPVDSPETAVKLSMGNQK